MRACVPRGEHIERARVLEILSNHETAHGVNLAVASEEIEENIILYRRSKIALQVIEQLWGDIDSGRNREKTKEGPKEEGQQQGEGIGLRGTGSQTPVREAWTATVHALTELGSSSGREELRTPREEIRPSGTRPIRW